MRIGSHIGVFEVAAPLGAGGMGEVYRARDTRLGRDVALKVLPGDWAADAHRRARFDREACLLAALNHLNIATLYGVEETSAGPVLVMELVEGTTLADRLALGDRFPLAEALAIARQISDALEAAHEQGIVHRDLKPANVMVRPDGTVKVLDFGLAKVLGPEGATMSAGAMNAPTLTRNATEMGVILGTVAYMAPEQARGKPVDRRADIWAFGCVLYELVTGRRAFDGEDTADVLARLIEREPDWNALSAKTPADVRWLLMRCLTKDAKSRLRDIGEARVTLDEVLARGSSAAIAVTLQAGAPPRASWLRALPWGLAIALGTIAALPDLRAPNARRARPVHVEINLPADVDFFSGPSLSADGRILAFVGVRLGIRQIYTRSLDEIAVRPVAGTDTAVSVALSPDGAAAAFLTNDTRLKRVVFANGVVEPLADGAAIYSGPAWAGESIVFSRGASLALRSRGGAEQELAKIDAAAGEVSLSWPTPVAGDRTVLFVSRRRSPSGMQSRVEAVPTAGGARRVVLEGAEQVVFASADRILFERGGVLYVAPFNGARAETTGEPVRLTETAAKGSYGGSAVAVAPSGALLIASPSVLASRLVFVSMTGVDRPVRGVSRGYQDPRVSPDGRLVAFTDAGTIWTLDPERNAFTRVTASSEPMVGFSIWSTDGKRIYYSSADGIRYQSADGEGRSTLLPNTVPGDSPNSFSSDGATLVMLRIAPETAGDIYATPAEGGELKPLLVTKAYEGGAQVSKDGKWLLYGSNESGRMEVFLRPLGGPDRKWPVSSEGGLQAVWSRDGRQIFYRSGERVLAVDVTTMPEVRLGAPRVLFDKRYAFGRTLTIANYSLTGDGHEFLMVQEEAGGRYLNLVLDWLPGLGRQQ